VSCLMSLYIICSLICGSFDGGDFRGLKCFRGGRKKLKLFGIYSEGIGEDREGNEGLCICIYEQYNIIPQTP